jgi:hypothetical protein
MTPEERRERARIAANMRWSQPGARAEQSATIRDAVRRRLEAQVDPDGVMDPAERAAAVENAAKALGARLRAARARRARARRRAS